MRSRVRRSACVAALALMLAAACGCARKSPTAPSAAVRGWVMGFSAVPPVLDPAVVLRTLDLWGRCAPMPRSRTRTCRGTRCSPACVPIRWRCARRSRSRSTTGRGTWRTRRNRSHERHRPRRRGRRARARGRSLAEPEIRGLLDRWAAAVDSVLAPDWLGLASETNLVRAAAPPAV